jgi:hypothetical protein
VSAAQPKRARRDAMHEGNVSNTWPPVCRTRHKPSRQQ